MLDYKMSRMFYDLHTDRIVADAYRVDRAGVIARYELSEAVVEALHHDDVAFLARRTNGFLLRYYFLVVGMSETAFIAGLQANRDMKYG